MRIQAEIITGYDREGDPGLTREEIDHLWDQGVNMDDWDYVIITDPEILTEQEYEEEETEWKYFDHVPESERFWPREQTGPTSYRFLGPPFDKGDYVSRVVKKKRWRCDEYDIDRMLNGCCSNEWYLINWNGSQKAIGVAYHA